MIKLGQIRKASKISQAELGARLGIPQTTLSSYETMRRDMPVRAAKIIAKELGVDWKNLYEED